MKAPSIWVQAAILTIVSIGVPIILFKVAELFMNMVVFSWIAFVICVFFVWFAVLHSEKNKKDKHES